MASSRRNTGRARGNSNAGGGGGGGGGAPPRGGSSGGPNDRDRSNSEAQALAARARGMSDVRGLNYGTYPGSGATGGTGRDADAGKTMIGADIDISARTNGTPALLLSPSRRY